MKSAAIAGSRRAEVHAVVLFLAWGGMTALAYPDPWADAGNAPLALGIAAGLSYVFACFASCFFVFAVTIRFGALRARLLDSLKANAFGMYLAHYPFVVWLQFALLGLDLPAVVKAGIVFSGTLTLSWWVTAALRRIPAVAHIIGADRRSAAPRTPIHALPAE